jgi:hypothetical protein
MMAARAFRPEAWSSLAEISYVASYGGVHMEINDKVLTLAVAARERDITSTLAAAPPPRGGPPPARERGLTSTSTAMPRSRRWPAPAPARAHVERPPDGAKRGRDVRTAPDLRRVELVDQVPDGAAEAAEMMADLAALVDSGLVVVSEDAGGRLRYGLSAGPEEPCGA